MATAALYIPPVPTVNYAHTHATSYAGIFVRFFAFALDMTLISLIAYLLSKSIPTLAFIFPALYFIFFWSRYGGGATLGMRLFRLHLVTANGLPLSLARACGRLFVFPLSFAIFYLGVIWIALDPRKQGWHDKLAGTFILRG